jgi:hypothetical protein
VSAARRAVHHRGGDVEHGDHRVERRGRGVHHVRLVEAGRLDGARSLERMWIIEACENAASSLCVDCVA